LFLQKQNLKGAACVFALLRVSHAELRWVNTVQRLVSLDTAFFNFTDLRQLHQFLLSCSLETRLGLEATKDMRSLKETSRFALEGEQTNPSATQQQVSATLRHIGLSVEDEVRCQKSGCSIDVLAHDSALEIGELLGGERSNRGESWEVELTVHASGPPTGATLLKRRHLELLGHTLVSVPYQEWDRGSGDRMMMLFIGTRFSNLYTAVDTPA
jgi:hypothetical protein